MMTDDDDDDNLNGTHFAAQVVASWALAPFQREVGRIPAGLSIFSSGGGIYQLDMIVGCGKNAIMGYNSGMM